MADDLETLTIAVAALVPAQYERTQRWTHLSLCVIDAVFSINARYSTTVRTANAYAAAAQLAEPLLPVARAHDVIGTEREEPLSYMLARIDAQGVEGWATEELGNRQRTSTRSGVLKAQAVYGYGRVLVAAGVERLGDVPVVLADTERRGQVEAELGGVPGHGTGEVRMRYLWMLTGDDTGAKPDRMVLRWISRERGRLVDVDEARSLIDKVARRLGCSAWAVDHAIWLDERNQAA